MNVRYFAAARAAAGVEEERFDLPTGATVSDLLQAVLGVERPEPPAGTPPLPRILSRSGVRLKEVAVRDRSVGLAPGEVVDVLPPFAGGEALPAWTTQLRLYAVDPPVVLRPLADVDRGRTQSQPLMTRSIAVLST